MLCGSIVGGYIFDIYLFDYLAWIYSYVFIIFFYSVLVIVFVVLYAYNTVHDYLVDSNLHFSQVMITD